MLDLHALTDLRTPWCLHVVATLHIAEHINNGMHDIPDLAAAAKCDAYALHRVMQHLVGIGIFAEPTDGQFVLNDSAQQLLSPQAHLGLDLDGIGGRMAQSWGTLLSYVRTGVSSYQEVFGMNFWDDLVAHPKVAADLDQLMGMIGHGAPEPNFELRDGWAKIRTVVDVGGGTGLMLAGILQNRPNVRGILVEQPSTIDRSIEIFQSAGVEDRVTRVAQSFFDPLPPGGDIYLLRAVLHDWPDNEAILILKRCAEAARPNGRVVVLKGLVSDHSSRPVTTTNVMLGGKDRTETEFRELAQQSGLQVITAGRGPSGYFLAECVPQP